MPASLREFGASTRPILGLLLAAAILSGCATGSTPFFATTQPENLGDLKFEAREYKRSGAYDRDLAAVAAAAEAYVVRRAGEVVRPALILDIDETSLSNWPEIEANDFGYIANGPCWLPQGPCGVRAWEQMGRAKAIAPTLALFNAAKAKGVGVFFITGRHETQRAATAANLRAAGYRGWSALIMRPVGLRPASAADYKSAERAKIAAKGFTIIANVGDQPSDLAGGHAERSFLLPNPFYRIQ